jgi:hypothetical protein
MGDNIIRKKEQTLVEKKNNLIEKFSTEKFHKITTRAGHEDFSLVTIDDKKMKEIAERMDEINRGLNAFAKTNTIFVSEALTLSEVHPVRNIRQIHAQIESKRGALAEAQFRLLKQQNDLKRKLLKRKRILESEKYQDEEERALDLERIEIEIEELKSKMVDGRVHIEQAIKEIGMYQDALDSIVETFGMDKWDEVDMEIADLDYNLRRCFYQSLRSCRMYGYINEPNQEWLEQMGINPSFVQAEMLHFLDMERKEIEKRIKENSDVFDDMNVVDDFIDSLVKKYLYNPIKRIKERGINTIFNDKWMFKDEERIKKRKELAEKGELNYAHKKDVSIEDAAKTFIEEIDRLINEADKALEHKNDKE